MWAGRLTQYPDEYSFKRRLLNGLPSDLRYHLALYDGVSAEHSSINEIVSKARHLEKTLISIRSGRRTEGQSMPGTPGNTGATPQRSERSSNRPRPSNPPTRRQSGRTNDKTNLQPQRTGSKPVPTKPPQPGKGDTSKLTCYKCGKVGHIATDPKCPQYKKPTQCQMFAAQVIDDRSENDQPDADKTSEDPEETTNTEDKSEDKDKDSEPSDHSDCPEGSQYDSERSSYEEYNGYAMPSEDDNSDLEYIRAMHEDEVSARTSQPQLSNIDWEPR